MSYPSDNRFIRREWILGKKYYLVDFGGITYKFLYFNSAEDFVINNINIINGEQYEVKYQEH